MFKFFPMLIVVLLNFVVGGGNVCADVIEVPVVQNRRTVGMMYKLSVTPASEMVPAFKYRLTVEPHKTIPGNAITHYLRSLGESSLKGPWEQARNEFGMDVHEWYSLETKADDIPIDKLRTAAGYFDGYVENHLRRATLCRDADWGLAEEQLRGRETIEFLLPSVQQTRSMARVLVLRNRLAVIDGRYEDSIDHLRMTYQLGQNVSKMRFLVASLVGIAEIGMANQGMLDLIAAKDSPNMYWALAELPQPIISIRESLRLESSFAFRYFPVLMDVETANYSNERWSQVLTEVIESISHLNDYIRTSSPGELKKLDLLSSRMLAAGAALSGYSAAKQRLLESGMDPTIIKNMAVAQVILIDAARDCTVYSNNIEKAYYLPYETARQFSRDAETKLRSQTPLRLGALIVDTVSPAIEQVRQAELRIQAQINLLMAIESIRNHIATTGKLPASLDELELPVRNDPFTNKPLSYELQGETATLQILESGQSHLFRYAISIAPKE